MLNVRRLCVVVDSLISAAKVCNCEISAWRWQVYDRVVELLFGQNILCQPLILYLTSWGFKPVPIQSTNCSVQWTAAKECLVKAYITTKIVSKTLLFWRSDKRQDFAWNRQQTEWNIVHKLSPPYLQKPVYGSMPLEPSETRPRSNFPESIVAFPRYNQQS